jgi:SAM-dependent methyltransferase
MTGQCLICNNTDFTWLHPKKGIVQCADCGFVTTKIEIDPRSIYNADYFQGQGYSDYECERGALQVNFRKRLKEIRRLKPEGALFEIGCAYGFFLELAAQYYTTRGIDISDDAARYARENVGVNVLVGDFLSLPDPDTPQTDVICMWDVIEHLVSPDAYVEKASRWLKPGGLLALSTGDISSFVAKWRGARWRLIVPPHHLHYFTPKTLARLFERFGLEIVHLSYPAFWRTYESSVRLICPPGIMRSLLTLGGRLNFSFPVNTFDLMAVIARKTAREPNNRAATS